jgi:non-heme chloroperoxidase
MLATQSITHSKVTLRTGRAVHLAKAGKTGTPPVLLLHGYADSWRSFEPLFPLLDMHFELFAPDQRGHGESDAAEEYDIAEFTRDAAGLITSLDIGPVHVIGHSLGAIVAQRLAVEHPTLIRRLVLIGGAPTAASHPGLRELQAELQGAGDPIPADMIEAFQTSTVVQPLDLERLGQILSESAKLGRAAWLGTVAGLLDESPEAGNRTITVHALALWGKEDPIFDDASQLALARIIPNLTVRRYPGVGHAPNWEVPNHVAHDILMFLEPI